MPKPKNLHDNKKARPISIEKPCPEPKDTMLDSSKTADPDIIAKQFQLELCWCIQQLERSLSTKKLSDKQMLEVWKTLKLLKSNSQPTIRKRQLMRTHFGDYRAKMLEQEKKLIKMASKMKITEKPTTAPKATFLRKSAFQSTGDSSFRFNFDIKPEETDNHTTKTIEEADTSNKLNSNSIDGNTSNAENSTTFANCGDGKTKSTLVTQDTKNFKFRFSESEFKFNFDVPK